MRGLQEGGAIYLEQSSATLNSCTLSANRAKEVTVHVLEADYVQEGAGIVR